MVPNKLKSGDTVAVVAPARSLAIISPEIRQIANETLESLGLKVLFAPHVEESDEFHSSSVEHRVADLHWAFKNSEIKGIFTVIGGFNSNDLLDYIDWELVKNNPKFFCGFSDITVLNNAIFAKTGLVTYSGPHYSTFGQKHHQEYTLDYFKKCLMTDEPFEVQASTHWTNDPWYKDQEARNLIPNEGIVVINEGHGQGTSIGSSSGAFNLLQGTQYYPEVENSIVFMELPGEYKIHHFKRLLQSMIHLPHFKSLRGIVIGRFEKNSEVTTDMIRTVIKSKPELDNLPVISGIDFGHSDPRITFPIGGEVKIDTSAESKLTILKH